MTDTHLEEIITATIHAVQPVCDFAPWQEWARAWLASEDRSRIATERVLADIQRITGDPSSEEMVARLSKLGPNPDEANVVDALNVSVPEQAHSADLEGDLSMATLRLGAGAATVALLLYAEHLSPEDRMTVVRSTARWTVTLAKLINRTKG